MDFKTTSHFVHLIPDGNTFFSHPLDYISTCLSVYKMHTLQVSEETAERRRKKVESVRKRALYRQAHGLDLGLGDGPKEEENVYTDFQGRRRPAVKKWFGIW